MNHASTKTRQKHLPFPRAQRYVQGRRAAATLGKNGQRLKKRIAPALAEEIRWTPCMAKEIAEIGGMRKSYVSAVIHGRRPPSARFLEACAKAFRARSLRAAGRIAEQALEGVLEGVQG